LSCPTCPLISHPWLELEYFRCLRCGNAWLDHPLEAEAWRCPSCGAEGVPIKALEDGRAAEVRVEAKD
jgi:rubrerythrin